MEKQIVSKSVAKRLAAQKAASDPKAEATLKRGFKALDRAVAKELKERAKQDKHIALLREAIATQDLKKARKAIAGVMDTGAWWEAVDEAVSDLATELDAL